MSLFQTREWWSVQNGSNEEFHPGCLCIGNIDDEPAKKDKIIIGSLGGILRVYYPRINEFKIEDLMIEEQLGHPILQIRIGRCIPNSFQRALVVLHPHIVRVFSLEGIGGAGSSASYFKLNKHYEHPLGIEGEHFTAFNMITGPFGHSNEKDHICVQSLDGRLQFFSQDSYAFTQQFNSCLIPGPICYVESIDSILTATTDMNVECYKYQVLATSDCGNNGSDENEERGARDLIKSKKLHVDWRVNIGESIIEIKVGRFSRSLKSSQFDIFVLGEFSFFCLKPKGSIRLQKRIGDFPSTCCLYSRPDDEDEENVIIATHSKRWMVFNDSQLIWSSCTSTVSNDITVSEFGNIAGMIVSLDETGLLNVNYLGTDPPSTIVGAHETKELNYEAMDEEHRHLLNVIRQSQSEKRIEPRDRVLLRAQVPVSWDVSPTPKYEFSGVTNFAKSESGELLQMTLRLFVSFTGKGKIRNVTISIQLPINVESDQKSICISSIDGGSSTPFILPICLYPSSLFTPQSLDANISAAYVLESGQPRVSSCQVKLPLCLACRLVPPIKVSTYKFTLDTNQSPPQLTELFDDMFTHSGGSTEWVKQVVTGSANVLSFQYHNGLETTILVSKNAGRYRIQASELDALYLITRELIQRLTLYYSQRSNEFREPLEIKYEEPLPLADFFTSIDSHFKIRQRMNEVYDQINDRSHQFRVIQKRLLVRYKDRSPAPLCKMDVLMHGTYEQIIALSNDMEDLQKDLKIASARLSCSVHLILLLIRYRFQLSNDCYKILEGCLSPVVTDTMEQGWEETTDAAMTHLLRTALAKSSKESTSIVMEFHIPDDTKKLKKHITIVCDRLAKGANLISPETRPTGHTVHSTDAGKLLSETVVDSKCEEKE